MTRTREPARLISLTAAAATATVGVVTIAGAWSAEIGGAITVAAGAWIAVAGELIRSRVTPTGQ